MSKKRQKTAIWFILILALLLDILFIITADLASFIIRFSGRFPKVNFASYLEMVYFIIALRILSFYIFRLYNKPKYKSNFEILINTAKAATASSIVIVFVLYFLNIIAFPRSIVFLSWLTTIILVSGWRIAAKEFIGLYLGKDFF